MLRSYLKGWSAALRQWRFVLLLFGLGLAAGGAFMACSWFWLSSALDSSLATRTLSTTLDANIFVDLAAHRADELTALAVAALLLSVGGSLLWVWVNAAVIAAVSGLHDSMVAACRQGAASYFQMLKLWAAALGGYTAVGVAAYVAARTLMRWTAGSPSELTPYWIVAGCALASSAAALIIATIHDHARIRCLGANETGGRAGLWACVYVVRERGAVPLTLLLGCTLLAVCMIYQAAAAGLAADSGLGLSLSLIWAQALMAARALLRVWAFAAATELQNSADVA
jgi:hypothetical protein